MFFGAYLGPENQADPWRTAVEQHARWLGMQFTPSVWLQPSGMVFTCAWLSVREQAIQPHMRVSEDVIDIGTRYDRPDSPPWRAESDPNDANEARLRLVQSRGDLSVIGQPLSPEHLFYTMIGNGIALSNDLRLLIRLTGLELDERAVYSLLQFGAILPPFSISRQIQRIPNGHTLHVRARPDTLTAHVDAGVAFNTTPLDVGMRPSAAVRQTLDHILARTPAHAALFFSGGVGSGLLAARLAALGRHDVRLINFSFGPEDEASKHAYRMARHLGMPYEQVSYDQSRSMDVLWRITRDHSVPFSDLPVLPMNLMIHAALGSGAQVPSVLDGIGADGIFGVGLEYRSWRRLYEVPHLARATVGELYKATGMWKGASRSAHIGRVLRRSAQMPLPVAALAQNSLDGIAYHIPSEIRGQLTAAVMKYRHGPLSDMSPEDQFSLSLLMHMSCGYIAPKSYDALRLRGIEPGSPYLEPEMIRVGFSLPWEQKAAGGNHKALTKALLVEQVPPELVYRRQSGFVPPYASMFASRPMQSYLREIVLSPSNPLAPYYDPAVVARMVARAGEAKPLNLEVYHFFLWSLTFLTAWLYPLYHREDAAKQPVMSINSA
ncbi:MAG: asparagine synthase-related protein [Nitrososphaerota archaeon]